MTTDNGLHDLKEGKLMSETVENESQPEETSAPSATSETVGKILEKARVEKGLTIDDIDRITHISPGWVLVIEQGGWPQYPSMVYAKGHVKVYAQLLGLDAEAMGRKFQAEWNATVKPDPNDVATLSHSPGIHGIQTGGGLNFKLWGVALFALSVVAILGVRYAMHQHKSVSGKSSKVSITPLPAPRPPVSPVTSGSGTPGGGEGDLLSSTGNDQAQRVLSTPTESPARTDQKGRAGFADHPGSLPTSLGVERGGLSLKMVAIRNTWVVISIDDGTVRRFHLKPGESRTLTGKNFMTFSTEFGNGLVLFLNGKRLGLAGATANPVLHRRLNRMSLRPLNGSSRPLLSKGPSTHTGQGAGMTGARPSVHKALPGTSPAKVLPFVPETGQPSSPSPSQPSVNSGTQPQSGRTP